MLQQHYDIGQKDSLVTDSVTYKLFYPRLRFQYTLTYTLDKYKYEDDIPLDSNYTNYFNYQNPPVNYNLPNTVGNNYYDTLLLQNRWQIFNNEFSIISYPQKNNLNQYLKLSAIYQSISGAFDYRTLPIDNQKNISASAEYRNRTRNQKWDVDINGELYLAGTYIGDYNAYISLQRQLTKSKGTLQIGFRDVNRTPSYILTDTTSFPVVPSSYSKENIAEVFAVIDFPAQHVKLSGEYYNLTNYVYFDSLYKTAQDKSLFNVLHISAEKRFSLSKYFNFYSEVHLQQTTPNAPVHLPLIVTRERLAFEGNFYHNLFLSTGIEVIYNSPYDADNYNPLTGQFFYQNAESLSNRPDANVFLNFRIKSFKGFVRFEHVSSVQYENNAFGFTHYNYNVPLYPTRTLWFRVGIWWNFVN